MAKGILKKNENGSSPREFTLNEDIESPEKKKTIKEEVEEPMINLDMSKIKYCKHSDCPQRSFGPHNHTLDECKHHSFCKMAKGAEIIDAENNVAIHLLKNISWSYNDYC